MKVGWSLSNESDKYVHRSEGLALIMDVSA